METGSTQTNKIIAATDFSAVAEAAVAQAMVIARRHGAELVLLHVCPVIEHEPGHLETGKPNPWEQRIQADLAERRARLEEMRSALSGQGVEVSHMVIDDVAHDAIIASAATLNATLIAVGTHGRTGLRRLLLGSVAERVVRGSEIDVLVARPAEGISVGFRRILVPTDFAPRSRHALEVAAGLVARGGSIDVHHYWQTPIFGPVPEPAVIETTNQSSLSERGAELIEPYQGKDFSVSFMAQAAHPTQGILETLDTGDHDLVVMGSHGRRGPRRWILGSVAEATVRHAPCSVMVVKGGEQGEGGAPT
jgi:nucleotide-binding universal stress UspA family protein